MPKISIDTYDKYNKKLTHKTNAQSTVAIDTEINEPPLITYYAKVIDNLKGYDVTNYKNAMDNDFTWYYGNIYNGESEYIIELDIWNNEPAFNHRFYDKHCRNANNIKLSVNISFLQNDEEYTNQSFINSFKDCLYVRIYNEDYKDEWRPINNSVLLVSNTTNNKGILYGTSDHCIIQTKLCLNNIELNPKRYYFNINISYDFE